MSDTQLAGQVINERRSEQPKVRQVGREAALREIKELTAGQTDMQTSRETGVVWPETDRRAIGQVINKPRSEKPEVRQMGARGGPAQDQGAHGRAEDTDMQTNRETGVVWPETDRRAIGQVINKRRSEKPEVRQMGREAALREIKERMKKQKSHTDRQTDRRCVARD